MRRFPWPRTNRCGSSLKASSPAWLPGAFPELPGSKRWRRWKWLRTFLIKLRRTPDWWLRRSMSRANLHDAGPDAGSGDDALELFPEWQDPITSRRLLQAGIGSLLVHAIVAAVLLTLPETSGRFNGPPITADFRKMAVPLYAPKVFEVTQKEPNKGKVTPQLDIRSSIEAPPKAKAFAPPAPAGPVVPPAATLTPPPQIQAEVATPPVAGVVPALPPPPEKPT